MTGDTVCNICKRYDTSRKMYNKWNKGYKHNGIESLSESSRRPHTIKY